MALIIQFFELIVLLSHYGGVCVLMNNKRVKATDVPLPPKFSHVELRVIDLYGVDKIRLFVCYRPPSHNTDPIAIKYLNDLRNCITGLVQSKGSIILCGDFNLPSIVWSADNTLNCNSVTCSGIFLDFRHQHAMYQFIRRPTRLNIILSTVLSNDQHCVLNAEPREPFSTSDHCQVCFGVHLKLHCKQPSHSYLVRDYNRANWARTN
jgi:Endonuclease-reverse transcriptase